MAFTFGSTDMETKNLIRKAHTLFNSGVPHIDRHNRKAWVRSVIMLGDKWLLAKPIRRHGNEMLQR